MTQRTKGEEGRVKSIYREVSTVFSHYSPLSSKVEEYKYIYMYCLCTFLYSFFMFRESTFPLVGGVDTFCH